MSLFNTLKPLNLLEKLTGTDSLVFNDNLVLLDHLLGLRTWGLILYGILPSNLALLGVLNVNIISFHELSIFTISAVSILPIIFLAMLVQDQNKKCYLYSDFIFFRSAIITFLILCLSTSIIGLSGVLNNKYNIGVPQNFADFTAIIECFLSAVSSLVISSSFFILAITRKSDLPGLPSISFIELIGKLDREMRELIRFKDWNYYTDYENHYIEKIDEIEKTISEINNLKGNNLAKKSITELLKDILNLRECLKAIGSGPDTKRKISWEIYFDVSCALSSEETDIREKNRDKFNSIQKLRNLKIGE